MTKSEEAVTDFYLNTFRLLQRVAKPVALTTLEHCRS